MFKIFRPRPIHLERSYVPVLWRHGFAELFLPFYFISVAILKSRSPSGSPPPPPEIL